MLGGQKVTRGYRPPQLQQVTGPQDMATSSSLQPRFGSYRYEDLKAFSSEQKGF